jgi:predicted DNA-binding transcriptional regulator YafY
LATDTLCLINQAWYLIARPTDQSKPKTYRIARFKSLRMTPVTAQVPENFDLHEYFGNAWGVYRGSESYDVEVAFTKEAAPLVTETIWHQTQQVHRQKDGSVNLHFKVDGLSEIVYWVLGWAGRARVVQPQELREMVAEKLATALAMHTG